MKKLCVVLLMLSMVMVGHLVFAQERGLPTVTTSAVTRSGDDVVSGGNVVNDGGSPVTARGICYGSNPNPDLGASFTHTVNGTGTGSFTSVISASAIGTIYVRAYATNANGTAYGDELSVNVDYYRLPRFEYNGLTYVVAPDPQSNNEFINYYDALSYCNNLTAYGYSDWTMPTHAELYMMWQNRASIGGFAQGNTYNGIFYHYLYGGQIYWISGTDFNNSYLHDNGYKVENHEGIIYTFRCHVRPVRKEIFLPTVTTDNVTGITQYNAVFGGNVTDDGGTTVTERGICWNTSPNPTISNNHNSNGGTGTGNFTINVGNLTPGTEYYVRAYAINSVGTSYGNEVNFNTLPITIPTVTTNSVFDITTTTAKGGGNVINNGGSALTERGICWSTGHNPTTYNSHITAYYNYLGSYTLNMTGLIPGTQYYVRAYATNSEGTAYGDEVSFITNSPPTVITNGVTTITPNSATCGGNVTAEGSGTVTARGVCWSTSHNPTISNSYYTNDGMGTGSYTSYITGLTSGTQYYVRAYATNSEGTAYGNEVSFTTPSIPTVTTNNVTNITYNSATCGGNVTDGGGGTVTARGVCWSTSHNPTISNSYTSDGTGTGSYTSYITGLTYGTQYYVRAYATNSEGTSYGGEISFTTAYYHSVTTDDVTYITQTSAICGGYVTAYNGATVTERGVCWSTTNPYPTMSNNHTSNGTGTGSFTSNLTGLTQNTSYYVRAYATSSQGTVYGETKQFTTTKFEYRISEGGVVATSAGGFFYDSGGPDGPYSNNEQYIMTFTSNQGAGTKIQMTFTSFYTENISDYLVIYDGMNTSAPLIGTYYGSNNSPGTVTATNSDGALTFVWVSNPSYYASGWKASISIVTPNYFIDVSANPGNGGTVSGGGYFDYGESCTLTTTPASGYNFVKWTKNGTQVSTNATYTFSVTGSASYVAHFSQNSYIITASANPTTGGTVSGTGSYNYGALCTLTATANDGYTFTNWTENGNVVSNSSNYSFNVYANHTLVANFQAQPQSFTINVSANPTNGGTAVGGGTYNQGAICTVTATANAGYTFTNWTENGNVVSTQANYTFQVNNNRSLVANFVEVGGDNCNIVFDLMDSYGDGWNGNKLNVSFSDGSPSQEITFTSGYNVSFVIGVNDGVYVTLSWTQGSYISECSFRVRYEIGPQIYYGSNLNSSFTYSFQMDCSSSNNTITFVDTNVKALCVANWDTNGDGELSYAEAAEVTYLGEVFKNNSSITYFNELQYFVGLTAIGSNAFYGCSGLVSVNIPNSVTSFGSNAFKGCSSMTSLTIPNTVTSIGNNAFFGCTGLTSIIIPSSVTSIGSEVFRDCPGLAQMSVCSGNPVYDSRNNCKAIIKTATNELVYGCKNTIIPNSVNSIGGAFDGCNSLTSIEIPNSVTSIGSFAFYNCSSLTMMTVLADTPPTLGNSVFFGVIKSIPVYVPCGSQSAYQSAASWSEFINYQEIECPSYTITASASPTNSGIISGGGTYMQGTTCILTATANTGYTFTNWTKDGTQVSANATYTFTVTESATYVANFTANPLNYTITVSANPSNGGSISGDGIYQLGQTCTLSATPNSGYTFTNWTENGSVVSTNATYSFTVSSNRTLVANFVEQGQITNHWTPVPGIQYNMTVSALVYIDGVEQMSGTLELGAFCGEQCRGAELPIEYEGQYWYFMAILGETGDTITFRLYDHALQQELDLSCTNTLEFVINEDIDPYAVNFVSDVTHTTDFVTGWTWWSTYIEQVGIDGLTMLENGLGVNGDMIKSQYKFTKRRPNGVWMGQLTELQNEEGYMVQVNGDCSVDMVGPIAMPENHPIPIVSGWNWIGYPLSVQQSVGSAMSGFQPSNNDIIKGQSGGFSKYRGGQWIPGTYTLNPGAAYMYYSTATEAKSLTYTQGGSKAGSFSADGHYWSYDVHKFADNISVLAVVSIDGEEQRKPELEIGAFVNGECRGSAKLTYVDMFDRYYAFLSVTGEDGDNVEFGLFDEATGTVNMLSESHIGFVRNDIVGDFETPYPIRFTGSSMQCWVFPNPSERERSFNVIVPDNEEVEEVMLCNALGTIVRREAIIGIPATIRSINVPGVYMVKVVCKSGNVYYSKLIVK